MFASPGRGNREERPTDFGPFGLTNGPKRSFCGYFDAWCDSPSAACPAASRAVSTRNGEHDT
jgi:hypothetical protein